MTVRSPIHVLGADFANPILLASGTAGFGREVSGVIRLDRLGGIVTKSVSLEPRAGNPAPRVAEFPGGMLNSIGLANPGVEHVQKVELPWLERNLGSARAIVSVVGSTVEDYARVVGRLTQHPVVTAFELNLSCPNTAKGGEHFGADDAVLADLIRRCRAAATRPVIAKLAPTLPDIARTASVALDAGADGLTVINTIPGTLYRDLSHTPAYRLGAGQGGVSGPALLAVGVLATERVKRATGLPVIGVGGVSTPDDVEQYLAAGADLVAIGTAAMAHPRRPEQLADAWRFGWRK